MLENFFTWEYLGSFAGIVAFLTLFIQFTKMPLDKVWKLPTRFVLWFVAAILLLVVAYFNGGITPEKVVLTLLNAVLVAWTSMGAYESVVSKFVKATEEEKPPG
jgi:uncharacterized membrane protein YqhA